MAARQQPAIHSRRAGFERRVSRAERGVRAGVRARAEAHLLRLGEPWPRRGLVAAEAGLELIDVFAHLVGIVVLGVAVVLSVRFLHLRGEFVDRDLVDRVDRGHVGP